MRRPWPALGRSTTGQIKKENLAAFRMKEERLVFKKY
jgi:hypothetical protein